MAALLTSVRDDKDKSALYLSECRRMGIKVLEPDINESDAEYTPRGNDIRFGLAAIRNVGEGVVSFQIPSPVRNNSIPGRVGTIKCIIRKGNQHIPQTFYSSR